MQSDSNFDQLTSVQHMQISSYCHSLHNSKQILKNKMFSRILSLNITAYIRVYSLWNTHNTMFRCQLFNNRQSNFNTNCWPYISNSPL